MNFGLDQLGNWAAMEMKIKRSIKKAVEEKAKAGNCLVCGSAAHRRGLCHRHYMEFRRRRSEYPKRDRLAFEAKQVWAGLILPSRAIISIKNPSPFEGDE